MERTDWLEEDLNLSVTLLTGAPGPWKMANPVREYDWGSTGALAALQGREPTGRPEAELWMGAHPAAPSRLCQPDGSEVSLVATIHANPVAVLVTGRRRGSALQLVRWPPTLPGRSLRHLGTQPQADQRGYRA